MSKDINDTNKTEKTPEPSNPKYHCIYNELLLIRIERLEKEVARLKREKDELSAHILSLKNLL